MSNLPARLGVILAALSLLVATAASAKPIPPPVVIPRLPAGAPPEPPAPPIMIPEAPRSRSATFYNMQTALDLVGQRLGQTTSAVLDPASHTRFRFAFRLRVGDASSSPGLYWTYDPATQILVLHAAPRREVLDALAGETGPAADWPPRSLSGLPLTPYNFALPGERPYHLTIRSEFGTPQVMLVDIAGAVPDVVLTLTVPPQDVAYVTDNLVAVVEGTLSAWPSGRSLTCAQARLQDPLHPRLICAIALHVDQIRLDGPGARALAAWRAPDLTPDQIALLDLPTQPRAPNWLRRPTNRDWARVWPPAARTAQVDGRVTLGCRVQTDGRLAECSVLTETPPRLGYGEAALALSAFYQMAPTDPDGGPTAGAWVILPLNFGDAGS